MKGGVILLIIALGASVLKAEEYHLEKSREIWNGFGVAFKYPDEFLLASEKLRDKSGMVTTNTILQGNDEWDLFATVSILGPMEGKTDGIVINLSRYNVYHGVAVYNEEYLNNFGFPKSIGGAYVLITRPSKEEGFQVEANAFNDQKTIKEKRGINTSNFGGIGIKKGVILAKGNQKIKLFFRYKKGTLSIFYQPIESKKPTLIKKFKKIALPGFYISMSAAVRKYPCTIKVSDLFFKTDTPNADLKFFSNHKDDRVPNVFKFIHLMNDMHHEYDTKEKQDFDIKSLRKDQLLKAVRRTQEQSLEALNPAEKIFDASVSEIELMFNYMEQHSKVTNKFFKGVLKEVGNMLDKSKNEFTFMTKDIEAIVKGFKRHNIAKQIKSSRDKLHSLVEKISTIESKLAKTSTRAVDLKKNLEKGQRFMDTYEAIFSNLPESLRTELDEKAKGGASLMNRVMKWCFIMLIVIVLLGFGCTFKFISNGKSKDVLL